MTVSNLRKLRNEYLQYKKLRYYDENFENEKQENDIIVPNVFIKKYNFIKNALQKNNVKLLFDKILEIDIEKLFYSLDIDSIDKNILLLADSYHELRKELHLKFDSDYNYLEDEITIQGNTM